MASAASPSHQRIPMALEEEASDAVMLSKASNPLWVNCDGIFQ